MIYSFEPGTVIFVVRGFYEHYGIYAGNDKVIHFDELNGAKCIHKTSVQNFLKCQDISECYVKHFPESKKAFELILKHKKINSNKIARFLNEFDSLNYHIFSATETLQRAEDNIYNPAWSYNLIGENCEHFAVWCKTGVTYSAQSEHFFNIIFG